MLSTPWDASIPLWPVWAIPYLLALPWWAGSLLWAALKMEDQLYKSFIIAATSIILIGSATYIFYPTFVTRPEVTGQGWASDLVRTIYQNDRTYNAFPSSHTYLTVLISLFWWRWKPRGVVLWILLTVLILLSTLFTGQHTLPDLIGGIILAVLGYFIGIQITRLRKV